MSFLEIHERFEVAAPAERVFAFLVDPRQVVVCLPGAELTDVESPTVFLGAMKVKVGPVTAKYKGRVELTEVREAERKITMVGHGKEGASDSAKLTMQCGVVDKDGGGRSEVNVDAAVEITGKLVRFGRGMIQAVSEQLFKVFVQEMKARLEGAEEIAPAPEAGAEAGAEAEAEAGAGAGAGAGAETEAETGAEAEAGAGAEAAPAPVPAPRHLPAPAPAAQPINVLPLLFKSMWDGIKRFFKRLFGRGQTPR